MKVAVCLSGQPRTFRSLYKQILERFSPEEDIQVDYFIHCWTDNRSYTQKGVEKTAFEREAKEALRNELVECFHPKRVVVESAVDIFGPWSPEKQWDCQMYSVQASVRLAEIPEEMYDWIFWTRLDLSLSDRSEDMKPAKIRWSTVKSLAKGKNLEEREFDKLIRHEDDNEELHFFWPEMMREVSIYTPFDGQKVRHWCNYQVAASDWFLMGKAINMQRVLGHLYDGFCWYRGVFPDRYPQLEGASVSMELFCSLWMQMLRIPLLPVRKNQLFCTDLGPVIIFRTVCEVAGVDVTKEGLEFVFALQDTGDVFEQNYGVSKVKYLWEGWKSRYSTKGLFESRKWLFEARNEYSSTNSSIRKGNKNTDLI